MKTFNRKVTVSLQLALFSVFIFDVFRCIDSYGKIPDICETPTSDLGSCIPRNECRSALDLLEKFPKKVPQAVETKLKEYACDEQDPTLICCSSSPIEVDVEPPPPDVSAHENLKLLPEECGLIYIGDKIRNGKDADLFEFPWMALLLYNTSTGPQFECGGTIINERYILTAAHCLAGTPSPLIGVRIGEYNLASEKDCDKGMCLPPIQDLPVEKVIYHVEFNESHLFENDVGLIRVPKINLEEHQAVCLPSFDEIRDQHFNVGVVTGWGFTAPNRTTHTGVLQKVDLPVQELDSCKSAYRGVRGVKLSYKQWCIGGTEKKDSCEGDSGGPLHVPSHFNEEDRFVQQGIVSFGHAYCGATGYPGVYTKVAYYMKWILDNIKS